MVDNTPSHRKGPGLLPDVISLHELTYVDPSIVILEKVSDTWTVDTALAAMPMDKPKEQSESPLPYFHLLERLKLVKREGWKRFGIYRGESIADHMYRMSLIAMVAPPSLAKRLDLQKCVKMCLIHDMAESVVGDLTPADQVPKIEKLRRETATMDYISNQVLGNVYGNSSTGEEIRAIWQEHEDSETLESHFVQDIDKVELLLQMVEYEKRGNGHINLSEFTYVATKLRLPEMKSWAQEILEDRTEFWNQYQSPSKEEKTLLDQTRKLQDQYYDG